MHTLFRILSRINTALGVSTFLAMCAVIFYQVVMRYVFNNALPWPEELGRYLFLLCTYASICLCIEENSQLRVEVAPISFPKQKKLFDFLSALSTVIFFGISAWLLWGMLLRVKKMGTMALTMPIPMWTLWGAIIFFCVLALVMGLKSLVSLRKKTADERN